MPVGAEDSAKDYFKTIENENGVVEGGEECNRKTLEREIQPLLDNIAPDNFDMIVGHMTALNVQTGDELDFIINLVYKNALDNADLVSMYADLFYELKQRFPEVREIGADGKETVKTFNRLMITLCQMKFEELNQEMEDVVGEDIQVNQGVNQGVNHEQDLQQVVTENQPVQHLHQVVKHGVVNMKIIGHLFLRRLLSPKIIVSIIETLLQPPEGDDSSEDDGSLLSYKIDCILSLLNEIGFSLQEDMEHVVQKTHIMRQWMGKLAFLKVYF